MAFMQYFVSMYRTLNKIGIYLTGTLQNNSYHMITKPNPVCLKGRNILE